MGERTREHHIIEPLAGGEPEIARWLWALEDTRRRTTEALAGLAPAALAWTPPGGGNSIGTLLYHLALIEADYLNGDILEYPDYPAEIIALLPYADRDQRGALTVPPASGLAEHLRRLDRVRARLLATCWDLPVAEWRRARRLRDDDITPEWTLHHLAQHEAEHRGHIGLLRALAERDLRATRAAPQ